MKMIDKSWLDISRLNSIRTAFGGTVLWSAVAGGILIWPSLADTIPIGYYIIGGILLSIAFGVARVLKQPGTE